MSALRLRHDPVNQFRPDLHRYFEASSFVTAASCSVANNPVAQCLPVHAAEPGGFAARISFDHQRQPNNRCAALASLLQAAACRKPPSVRSARVIVTAFGIEVSANHSQPAENHRACMQRPAESKVNAAGIKRIASTARAQVNKTALDSLFLEGESYFKDEMILEARDVRLSKESHRVTQL
jgi:hypothetical protein